MSCSFRWGGFWRSKWLQASVFLLWSQICLNNIFSLMDVQIPPFQRFSTTSLPSTYHSIISITMKKNSGKSGYLLFPFLPKFALVPMRFGGLSTKSHFLLVITKNINNNTRRLKLENLILNWAFQANSVLAHEISAWIIAL